MENPLQEKSRVREETISLCGKRKYKVRQCKIDMSRLGKNKERKLLMGFGSKPYREGRSHRTT